MKGPVSITAVGTAGPDALVIDFSDGSQAEFNLFWLADNCPDGFHPQTGERQFDLLSMPDVPVIKSKNILANGCVELQWAHDGSTSHFSPEWLLAHRPGVRRDDPAGIAPVLWTHKDLPNGPPRHAASTILSSDAALGSWLTDTRRYGLTLVDGIQGGGEASMAIARRIGFLRETNFGQTFEVMNKPDPNNLAYTALALPLHTDLTNQETPPGYQFLHCIANDAAGGGSTFADGFAIAQALREADEQAFLTLATVSIPCRFFDSDVDIRTRRPVISLDENGDVHEIAYNAHLVDLIDLPADTGNRWYKAYRAFMRLTRDSTFCINFRMAASEMAAFDNRRILHGREAFNPETGARHLHGCYVDRVEFDSRLRMLAATQ